MVDDFDKKKKKPTVFKRQQGRCTREFTVMFIVIITVCTRPFQISARQNTRGEKYVCVWGDGDAHVI